MRNLLLPKNHGLPELYSTESQQDPVARIKLFTPDSCWTWFLIEYDPLTDMAFGLVQGLEVELGYINLQEVRKVRGPFGLKVERDIHFKPTPLSELREKLQAV